MILDRQELKRQNRWIAMAVASIVLLSALYLTIALSTVVNAAPPLPEAPAAVAAPVASIEPVATPERAKPAATPKPAQALAQKKPRAQMRVNVNVADKSQLEKIPGLGPVRAQAVLDFRKSHGFLAAGDLMKVKGIGPSVFRKIEPFIAVDGPAVASSS